MINKLFIIVLTGCCLIEPKPLDWKVSVGTKRQLSQQMFQEPDRGYFTDGAVPVIKQGEFYYAFWANYRNYRTVSGSPLLENHVDQLDPTTPVFGGRQADTGTANGFNDGGMWLIGVHPVAPEGKHKLVGFFHAESHWYPRTQHGWYAYKSIGITYTEDCGLTWSEAKPILTPSASKGADPAWSGLGDGTVIFNHLNQQFYCYYTPAGGGAKICMATSSDPAGTPGTWRKWHQGAFIQPGLGGLETPIKNLEQHPGANPSVHWNTYLHHFVMAWHGWDGRIYTSISPDGEKWETPKLLLSDGDKAWYPVIVGEDGYTGGKHVTLYYSCDYNRQGKRALVSRILTFDKSPRLDEH